MANAYDLKDLAAKLKGEGLEVAEDAAAKAFKATLAWLKESAAKSSTPVDDMLVGLLAPVEKYVLGEIDKIDGQDDPDKG